MNFGIGIVARGVSAREDRTEAGSGTFCGVDVDARDGQSASFFVDARDAVPFDVSGRLMFAMLCFRGGAISDCISLCVIPSRSPARRTAELRSASDCGREAGAHSVDVATLTEDFFP